MFRLVNAQQKCEHTQPESLNRKYLRVCELQEGWQGLLCVCVCVLVVHVAPVNVDAKQQHLPQISSDGPTLFKPSPERNLASIFPWKRMKKTPPV